MFLMLCLYVHLSIRKFFVCMVDLVLNLKIFNKCLNLFDLLKYLIKDYCVICYGLIQRKECLDGHRIREE